MPTDPLARAELEYILQDAVHAVVVDKMGDAGQRTAVRIHGIEDAAEAAPAPPPLRPRPLLPAGALSAMRALAAGKADVHVPPVLVGPGDDPDLARDDADELRALLDEEDAAFARLGLLDLGSLSASMSVSLSATPSVSPSAAAPGASVPRTTVSLTVRTGGPETEGLADSLREGVAAALDLDALRGELENGELRRLFGGFTLGKIETDPGGDMERVVESAVRHPFVVCLCSRAKSGQTQAEGQI